MIGERPMASLAKATGKCPLFPVCRHRNDERLRINKVVVTFKNAQVSDRSIAAELVQVINPYPGGPRKFHAVLRKVEPIQKVAVDILYPPLP